MGTLTTVQGQDLTFKREFVNDERIISSDIFANNGIVHLINGVLIPEESDPAVAFAQTEFEPCSLCSSLDTELRFDYDYVPVGSVPDDVVAVLPLSSIEISQSIVQCSTVDGFCRGGNCSQKTCESLSIFADTCGCTLI